MTRYYRFDTETFPIVPGLLAPKLVCEQFAIDDGPVTVRASCEPGFLADLRVALTDGATLIEGHNLAFDLAVVCAHDWTLVQPVFRMLAEGRGRDTWVLEMLRRIYTGELQRPGGRKKGSLGDLAAKLCGAELDKSEESWRTRYCTLDGVPAAEYPTEAYRYAHDDVEYLRGVSKALRSEFSSPDEWLQVAAAFVLQLSAVWGLRTDEKALNKVLVKYRAEKAEAEEILTRLGILVEGKTNQTALRKAVADAAVALGFEVPVTEKGNVKADADTLESLAGANAELVAYSKKAHADKILSTYIEPMLGGITYAMNSRPNVLVATGRTSWAGGELVMLNPWRDLSKKWKATKVKTGTNIQNQAREEGIRDCFVPRPGHLWLSVDYDSLELRTLAQALLWVTGRSGLAEGYRKDPNYDPHTGFAAQILGISYDEAMQRKKAGDKVLKNTRQSAKSALFGYPGGSSAKTFMNFAASTYGIQMTLEEAVWLKDRWFEAYPEMHDFFDTVSWIANGGKPLRQFVSRRIRGDVGYCDCANGHFQSLAADGAKLALFEVSMACYAKPESVLFGSRPVAFIHDEICLEVPTGAAHECAEEVVRLMESSMQKFCPDVPIKASPALSTRWLKAAEAKYDEKGRLVPWDS